MKREAAEAQPTDNAPYSSVHLFGTDLSSVQFLTRKTLLLGLSKLSGPPLDKQLFGIESPGLLLEKIGFQINLGPNATAEVIVNDSGRSA